MAQGRIGTSSAPKGRYAFVAGQDAPAGSSCHEAGPADGAGSMVTGSVASAFTPEIADRWIMESIERKRIFLQQVTTMKRSRIAKFVELLFDEESDRCDDMVDAVLAELGDPQKVVERLFEPAARVIGENWCSDECDFVKVTIAMSRMQRMFRRIAAELPPASLPDITRCALLGPAPGEQHTFGLSVVDDAFRRGGWEVDCCGYDEQAEMYRLAALNDYRIIGLSVSVDRLVPDLVSIVRKLRSKSRNKSVVMIAGGSMVMQNPQGAIDAGFDLLAVDAYSAVALAEAVVSSTTTRSAQRLAAE